MSTDSDELDEDELLQMALKEQAQRELNFNKRSAGGRPVVNLVQPPPTPPFMATNNQRKANSTTNSASRKPPQKPPKGRAEADDDSEVELLSISSGDEDNSRARGPPPRTRGSAGERRGGKDDQTNGDVWDGDEPSNWKRVDEAELARRVREMRETRVAPVVPILEKSASTLDRKVLAKLQSMPRGIEALDPLGLGIIDSRTLTLITEDSESTPVKTRGDRGLDLKIREKIMYYSESFDAKLFLSRVHKDTTAGDLESGALTLKADLRGRTQQKKQLVKENFDCFVSCKSTIDDIESKLRQIEEDPEGSGTIQLCSSIKNISLLANRAFQPLFERQVQADKIRSVQGMLQRFRTLFNLPSAIRGNISKGEYDLAVREYRKAKSIVLPSHVAILKRVLEEVEKVMQEFKTMLYRSMEDPHLDLADLENTVRLLLELEPGSDPIWHFLNIQNRRIRVLLETCASDHEMRMEMLQNEIKEKARADLRWRELQQNSIKLDSEDSYVYEDAQSPSNSHVDVTNEKYDALRGRYIRVLTAVVIQHLPAFWKLSLSIFSGKFAKVSLGNTIDQETNEKTGKTEEKSGEMKYSSHSVEEVAVMFLGTLSVYQNKALSTFKDFQELHVLRPYMINSIKEVSKASQSMEAKESAPRNAVKSLRSLYCEMAKIYISRLLSWMRATTKVLTENETWVPLSVLERNRSPYMISSLPLVFRSIVVSAMDQINVMIQILNNEASKSREFLAQVQSAQESVRMAFYNCLLDFAGCLEEIGGELSESAFDKDDRYSEEKSEIQARGGHLSDPYRKLLIVLSNVGYCKEELCSELYAKYRHIWIQSRESAEVDPDVKDLHESFSDLEKKILEHYTLAKAELIRNAAVNYFSNSGIQWGGAPAVKGVRDATLDLLSTLVSVHAEVSCGAKPLLEKTLGVLVEGLFDTFLGIFQGNLDPNGFCQLMLELEYFETALHAYVTPDAREALKSLQSMLLEASIDSVPEVVENPGHHRRPTRGSEDALTDDKLSTSSPDDLLALSQQVNADLLNGELERSRMNISCFLEFSSLLPSKPPPPPPSQQVNAYARAQVDSPTYSPGVTRQRRR